jgi:hypothetical protein
MTPMIATGAGVVTLKVSVKPLRPTSPLSTSPPDIVQVCDPPRTIGIEIATAFAWMLKPETRTIALPASVEDPPNTVIELNDVPAGKSFVIVGFGPSVEKMRSSPATGAVPPHLAASDQTPPFELVHVRVLAAIEPWIRGKIKANCSRRGRNRDRAISL